VKEFGSLASFALHLIETEMVIAEALEHGLDRVLVKIETTAKSEIGVYQDAVGPFPGWPQLADSTEDAKAKAGYPAGAPLYATGDMQQSIEHQREGLEGLVGSNDEKIAFHEFGTVKMPARPVLGPAAFRNKDAIQKLVGAAVIAGLIGEDQIHQALGYDFQTKD
jgi:phage gpG-like protein